ncbi:MAG: thiamine-phosphate kinase, partial [Janthinobacterium lividum]
SGVGAVLDAGLVPLSGAGRAAVAAMGGRAGIERVLGGGDDYELLLAVPVGREGALVEAAGACGVGVTRVGRFVAGEGVRVVMGGKEVALARGGWSHF